MEVLDSNNAGVGILTAPITLERNLRPFQAPDPNPSRQPWLFVTYLILVVMTTKSEFYFPAVNYCQRINRINHRQS